MHETLNRLINKGICNNLTMNVLTLKDQNITST